MDWEAFYNSFRQPDFVPGYEIENRLGGGAFGDVYKARKTSIGKAYAIKFLKVENDDQREAVKRELDQVRHFAAIDHPNLVTIEDMGVVMDVPYVIMGYAGEETLAKRFKLGDLSPAEALLMFTQTARGVLALHDRRLVHFDLKPSNIFLRGENARVGDYGLSKLLEGGRTTLSFGRGTPMYMAPEMLRSRADHRADIYSLGVILFESIAGSLPFNPDELGGLVLRESDDPPVFPETFPAIARPAVEACLRLDPKDRPDSISEVLEMLGQTARPGDSVTFRLTPEESRPARPRGSLVDHASTSAPDLGVRSPQDSLVDSQESSPNADARKAASKSRSPLLASIEATTAETSPIEAGRPASRARQLVAELNAQKKRSESGTGTLLPKDDGRFSSRTSYREPPSAEKIHAAPAAPVPTIIPVPPKVTGGLFATLMETTRVGFDVFAAAIVAVVQSILGALRVVTDRLVRSDRGGVVGRTARFTLFLMIMASVGFGATLLGLFGLFVLERP
ncbi:MAG: serine/threonine protein kinase [Planctomycetota bacterium]|jgi:serine/threonine protein kinase